METLYERMGEQRAIDSAVAIFYRRVLDDPELSPYFTNIDIKKQRCKMSGFLAMAFGAEGCPHATFDLAKAHQHLNISPKQFDLAVEHFKETLEIIAIRGPLQEEILDVLANTRDQVVQR